MTRIKQTITQLHPYCMGCTVYLKAQQLRVSPNRKWLGKWYKGFETFDMSSPILCCFWSQLWQHFQISQNWDSKSQQPPSANPVDSHYKDETVVRPFYVYHGNLYTGIQILPTVSHGKAMASAYTCLPVKITPGIVYIDISDLPQDKLLIGGTTHCIEVKH